jgi:succinate dehydrogenase hydrophobic anchor subunit
MLLRENEEAGDNGARSLSPHSSMKQLLATVSSLASSSILFVSSAFAALPTNGSEINGLSNNTDIRAALVNIITRVLDFIIIVAVIFVIIAGIRLIISGGEEGEKDKAKNTIIYVIIGIIVVLFARVIVVFVNNIIL